MIAVSPTHEQRTIAAFLDRETAKIDALVARKERLIELLQEKRSALVTRTVTRGLDPNVPMKDSGVEWLGEIPAHWDVAPVYARYEVALGKMLDGKQVTGESLGRYLRNVDVQWDAVQVDDLPEMDFSQLERNRYLLLPGRPSRLRRRRSRPDCDLAWRTQRVLLPKGYSSCETSI